MIEGIRLCSATLTRPPGLIHSHILSCFTARLDQSWRNKNTDAEAALDTSLSAQLFPSLPGCGERQGNERFFHDLKMSFLAPVMDARATAPGRG